MRMEITSFQVGSRTYTFKEPLTLKSENVEGGLCLVHKELSLSACGKSFGECVDIIREELAVIWGEYALAQDNELTPGASILKNKLLAMVEEAKR